MVFKNNDELKEYLLHLDTVNAKDFNEKIQASDRFIYGVKIPSLRAMAKACAKEDVYAFLNVLSDDSFEEVMLFGMSIGYANIPFEERLRLIDEYLEKANSWGLIDSVVSTYKFIGKDRERFLPVVQKYLRSTEEFKVRFALVALLCYYVSEEYLSYIFDVCDAADCSPFYVSMAVAWLVSVCFAKYPVQTEKYLNHTKLDDLTFNRTVRKILDSYRVDELTKQKIKLMKRKTNGR